MHVYIYIYIYLCRYTCISIYIYIYVEKVLVALKATQLHPSSSPFRCVALARFAWPFRLASLRLASLSFAALRFASLRFTQFCVASLSRMEMLGSLVGGTILEFERRL